MTKQKQITVLAAESQDALESNGAFIEDNHCETIADAKRYAKYVLTQQYANVIESSSRLGYAQVLVDGDVRYDYFATEAK